MWEDIDQSFYTFALSNTRLDFYNENSRKLGFKDIIDYLWYCHAVNILNTPVQTIPVEYHLLKAPGYAKEWVRACMAYFVHKISYPYQEWIF
jgi:hypothetical protein